MTAASTKNSHIPRDAKNASLQSREFNPYQTNEFTKDTIHEHEKMLDSILSNTIN